MSDPRTSGPVGYFSPADSYVMDSSPLFRVSRGVVLLVLGVIYGGCIQFFITVSPGLLYGTYLVIATCLAVCLFLDWSPSRNLRSVAPYLIWIAAYFLWGIFASSNGEVFKEGVKFFIKNLLIISAMALALDRRTVTTFSQLVQLAIIGNFALCVWETFDPELIRRIALTRDPNATAYNVMRPAGLWTNPDEASTAYIFGILLTRWVPGPLAWFGRIASIIGVALSASRTGVYVIALCGAIYAWGFIRQRGLTPRVLAGICAGVLVAAAAGVVLANQSWLVLPQDSEFRRVFDPTEKNRGVHEPSRFEIATISVQTALEGPWYGHGLFAYQHEHGLPSVMDLPAHNGFLTVWGESGPLIAAWYVAILTLGIVRTLRSPLRAGDQNTLLLMWSSYLIIALTWHNQFTAFSGMIYIALLWHLPVALRDESSYPGVRGPMHHDSYAPDISNGPFLGPSKTSLRMQRR